MLPEWYSHPRHSVNPPSTLRGWKRTPPKVNNPMMVCSTDLATPTREAVSAEQRAAQRNCEYVRRDPENTRRTNVGKKPAAKMEHE